MKKGEAETLKVGDRVFWDGNPSDCGEVVETWRCGVDIRWDNGTNGAIHTSDCERVGKCDDTTTR